MTRTTIVAAGFDTVDSARFAGRTEQHWAACLTFISSSEDDGTLGQPSCQRRHEGKHSDQILGGYTDGTCPSVLNEDDRGYHWGGPLVTRSPLVGHDPQSPTTERDEPMTNVAPSRDCQGWESSIVSRSSRTPVRLSAIRHSTFLAGLTAVSTVALPHGLPPQLPQIKAEHHGRSGVAGKCHPTG